MGENFSWSEECSEATELQDNFVNWVLMGSSFHWADSQLAVKEFYRIFTAISNPRDIGSSELYKGIAESVYSEVPKIKRVSSDKSISAEEMKENI